MEPARRLALLEQLTPEQGAGLLERIPVDDAVFVLESLPGALHDQLLELVDLRDLADVHTQLAYPESSPGRLMHTEFFALPETATVRESIAALQEKRDVEMIFYLYVIDRDGHLVGVTSLRQLLLSRPEQSLAEIMQRSVTKVHVDTDQEEVARHATRYDLLAAPVVDDQNHLAGIIRTGNMAVDTCCCRHSGGCVITVDSGEGIRRAIQEGGTEKAVSGAEVEDPVSGFGYSGRQKPAKQLEFFGPDQSQEQRAVF